MTTTVRKVDGGYQLFVPDELAARVGLANGTELTVEGSPGRLVAEAAGTATPRKYTLEELVAGITSDNRHGEVDWGPPVGKERFWEDQ